IASLGLMAERQDYNVTLAILTVAGTAYALQQTMVIPALPALQRELHTTTTWVTWVLTALLLVASVSTPILGKLGDQYGKDRLLGPDRRPPFVALALHLRRDPGGDRRRARAPVRARVADQDGVAGRLPRRGPTLRRPGLPPGRPDRRRDLGLDLHARRWALRRSCGLPRALGRRRAARAGADGRHARLRPAAGAVHEHLRADHRPRDGRDVRADPALRRDAP